MIEKQIAHSPDETPRDPGFAGIWICDAEQFDVEASHGLFSEEPLEMRYADGHLECVFFDENLVFFSGTDF